MQLLAALHKEFLLQWRTKAQLLAIFVFGAASLLLFSFAIGPDSSALRQHAAAFLWLGLMLSSTLTLAESFQSEMEQRALEGLLLLPAGARALYYGKAISNWAQLSLLGVGLIPLMVILGFMGGLIFLQPDFSAAFTVIILGVVLFFLADGEWRPLALILVVALVIGWLTVNFYPTGKQRVLDFIAGFQLTS